MVYDHLDDSFGYIKGAIVIDEVIYSDASLKGWGQPLVLKKQGVTGHTLRQHPIKIH